MPTQPLPDHRNLVAAIALNNLLFRVTNSSDAQPQHALDIAMEAHDAIHFLVAPTTPYCLHRTGLHPLYYSYHRVNARQCLPSEHAPGLSVWRVQELQGGTVIGRGDLVSVWIDNTKRVPLVGLVQKVVVVEEGLVRLTLTNISGQDTAILFIPVYLTSFNVIEKVILRIIRPSEPLLPTPPIQDVFTATSDANTTRSHTISVTSYVSSVASIQSSPTYTTSQSMEFTDADDGSDVGTSGPDDIPMTSLSHLMQAPTDVGETRMTDVRMAPYVATVEDVHAALKRTTPKVDQAAVDALNHFIRFEHIPFCCLYSA